MTAFCLSADDYGYRPGVSAAIRALAAAGRLSATSALVTFPDWADAAPHVGALSRDIDVGLHLNLVEGAPLGPMPKLCPEGRFPAVGDLIRLALTAAIDPNEIRAETERQWEAFTAAAGRAPDFLDGHQHAHALPLIGQAVLDVLPARVPVRDPSDRWSRILKRGVAPMKALVIAGLTRGFGRLARSRGHPTNDGFSGVYDLKGDANLDALHTGFAAFPGPRHLVMCHPGHDDTSDIADPIRPARVNEARFLAGPGATDWPLKRFTVLARG